MHMYIHIYIYIYIYIHTYTHISRRAARLPTPCRLRLAEAAVRSVSIISYKRHACAYFGEALLLPRYLKLRSVSIISIFEFVNLRVSNPNKSTVDVFLTRCRISMWQGLGPKKHDETSEIDRGGSGGPIIAQPSFKSC